MIRISSMQRLDTTTMATRRNEGRYYNKGAGLVEGSGSGDDVESLSDYDTCAEGTLSRNCSFLTTRDFAEECSWYGTKTTPPQPSSVPLPQHRRDSRTLNRSCSTTTTTTTSTLDAVKRDNASSTSRPRRSDLLSSCPSDVLTSVLFFLDVPDLRAVAGACRALASLVRSSDAVWFARAPWPATTAATDDGGRRARIVVRDRRRTPRVVRCALAVDRRPTTVAWDRGALFRRIDATTTRFVGRARIGDRSARADEPFFVPRRPRTLSRAKKRRAWPSLLSPRASRSDGRPPTPFVQPFATRVGEDADGALAREFDAAPRLFSYYEVTVLATDDDHYEDYPEEVPRRRRRADDERYRHYTDDDDDDDDYLDVRLRRPPPPRRPPSSTEMIAVGLSSRLFRTNDRMPGWDAHSYGYHGDDGGVFHANGDMLRRYGPTYGVGDTVGCGIDWLRSGIFFTLNGAFLGFAWDDVDLRREGGLYATVGVDTRAPFKVNFGDEPFLFDTTEISDKHEDALERWADETFRSWGTTDEDAS